MLALAHPCTFGSFLKRYSSPPVCSVPAALTPMALTGPTNGLLDLEDSKQSPSQTLAESPTGQHLPAPLRLASVVISH